MVLYQSDFLDEDGNLKEPYQHKWTHTIWTHTMATCTEVWEDENGHIHREDGPAVIYDDGSVEYWQHGRLHRIGGPAIDYPDTFRKWYQDNNLYNNSREWWVDNYRIFSKEQYQKATGCSDADLLAIILKYGEIK